jgi:hypothetical protein
MYFMKIVPQCQRHDDHGCFPTVTVEDLEQFISDPDPALKVPDSLTNVVLFFLQINFLKLKKCKRFLHLSTILRH